ncbi:protein-export chaperone SecB [Streptococcus sp. 121]|uniref:protein-export chaperone SecB n=1 Tax=Streptococcus sp. 121 TaxID=2797637 RepID=UPI0018F08396|nr:protein-export chaperone SecB [Streptococcus sp. 121]MBJ6745707.1 protein-export chaperone SecB [Streptococcus sp. 121]
MAIITFENYVVDESFYRVNDAFENIGENLSMPVEFSAEIGVEKTQEKAYVIINIGLGKLEEDTRKQIPFTCNVSVRGIYSYQSEDFETNADLKDVLGKNALAILYPYVRTYVSTLTNLGNQFPVYTLPVMNFSEILQKNDLITFIGFDD